MKLRLSNKAPLWALMHPSGYYYVGGGQLNSENYNQAPVQEFELTLTAKLPGPINVDFDNLPKWAQDQITSSLTLGTIERLDESKAVIEAKVDYGLLNHPVNVIKEKVKDEPLETYQELLENEQKGLNSIGKPRIGLVNFLKEEIENRT